MIKKAIKYILRILMLLVSVVVLYFILSFLLARITTNPEKVNCPEQKEIYLSSNGIHVDIVIPRNDVPPNLVHGILAKPTAKFLAFGWGDKGFYLETPTWDQLKLSVALKAIFVNSETAMHVTNYENKSEKWVKISLCESQLQLLLAFITESFELDSGQNFQEIPDTGYTQNDTFFEANGSYNGIQTCNNWVNLALKKAKIKTAVWAPFESGVLRHFEK